MCFELLQQLAECPCAAAVAESISHAIDDALNRNSADNYAYSYSSPGVPPVAITATDDQPAYATGLITPKGPEESANGEEEAKPVTPAEAAAGSQDSYSYVMQTLTRDVSSPSFCTLISLRSGKKRIVARPCLPPTLDPAF